MPRTDLEGALLERIARCSALIAAISDSRTLNDGDRMHLNIMLEEQIQAAWELGGDDE